MLSILYQLNQNSTYAKFKTKICEIFGEARHHEEYSRLLIYNRI